MHISIAERLRPFCHEPGTSTILPGWGYQVQVFPCLIRLYQMNKSPPLLLTELNLDFKGPVEQFTICNDLEKGRITIWGKTAEGWMRYHLMSALRYEGIRLLVERAPLNGFPIAEEGKCHLLHPGQWLDLLEQRSSFEPYLVPPCDRLSLGNHQAQDWEMIKRRFNLKELLPLVHRLGQLLPALPLTSSQEGTLALLEDCHQSFSSKRPEQSEEKWKHFFLGCLSSLLVPQLEDVHYQGLVKIQPLTSLEISPLVILSEGSRLIRELFVQQEKDDLAILPHLLPSLPCGRLLNVPLADGGLLSLEWTKKTIRRLILHVGGEDREFILKFHSSVRHYRLRQNDKEKGERKSCRSSLILKKNCRYLLDNFQ